MTKQRKLSEGTRARIQARAVVAPYVEKMGPLLDRAIFLETLASVGRIKPALIEEAEALAAKARHDLHDLDQRIAELEPEVASNGRVVDARRALTSVVHRFERAHTAVGISASHE